VAGACSGDRGSVNIACGVVRCYSASGLVKDIYDRADGPGRPADTGPVDWLVGQEVSDAGGASPHRLMSEQSPMVLYTCMGGAAFITAGLMRTRNASRAYITADTQVETASRGGLSGPEKKNAQNRCQT